MLAPYFTVAALEEGYRRYCDNHFDIYAGRPRVPRGHDGISLELFEPEKEKHFRAISRKVLQGRYTFAPWRLVPIPKSGGETREIAIAGIRDALVQRGLYEALYARVEAQLGRESHGFRKGLSAHTAVAAIREHFKNGRTFVFDADVRKFFDSVDHALLLSKVEALGLDPVAENLVWRFLRTGHRTPDGVVLPTKTVGVPQGGVVSGLLANLFLSEFDRAVSSTFKGLVRYADDFVICCDSPAECDSARELSEQRLASLKLQLHPTKTRAMVNAADGVNFLGFLIKPGSTRISQSNVDRFKGRIRNEVTEWHAEAFNTHVHGLSVLVRRLSLRIRGPGQEHIKVMLDRNLLDHPHRRNWPAFFRIADDIQQFRGLDRWIHRQISHAMWAKFQKRIRVRNWQRNAMSAGLPSLVNAVWKSRRRHNNVPRAEP